MDVGTRNMDLLDLHRCRCLEDGFAWIVNDLHGFGSMEHEFASIFTDKCLEHGFVWICLDLH